MADPALKMVGEKGDAAANPRREKFVDLAQKRTVSAIKAIRVISKLGNKSAYDYTDEDVRKIVKALTDEIETLKNRMKGTKRSDDVEFKL